MAWNNGYTNQISDIDAVTDNPENYSSPNLRRAIHEAKVVYDYGNKPYEWYAQVRRICNEEVQSRGENPE